jgi:hypothetical protein
MNGMDSSYTRWFHHGEDISVDVVEHPIDAHGSGEGEMWERMSVLIVGEMWGRMAVLIVGELWERMTLLIV